MVLDISASGPWKRLREGKCPDLNFDEFVSRSRAQRSRWQVSRILSRNYARVSSPDSGRDDDAPSSDRRAGVDRVAKIQKLLWPVGDGSRVFHSIGFINAITIDAALSSIISTVGFHTHISACRQQRICSEYFKKPVAAIYLRLSNPPWTVRSFILLLLREWSHAYVHLINSLQTGGQTASRQYYKVGSSPLFSKK